MDRIFEYIKVKRSLRGMSQKDLAERAGISVNTLIKIEQGQSNPTIGVLRKLYEVLSLDLLAVDRNKGMSRLTGGKGLASVCQILPEDEQSIHIGKVLSLFNAYEQFKDKEGKIVIPVMAFSLVLFDKEEIDDDACRLLMDVIERCAKLVNKFNDQDESDMRIEDISLSKSAACVTARYVMGTEPEERNLVDITKVNQEIDVKMTREINEHLRKFSHFDYIKFEEILGTRDNAEKITRMDAFLQEKGWDERLRRQYILTSPDFKIDMKDMM